MMAVLAGLCGPRNAPFLETCCGAMFGGLRPFSVAEPQMIASQGIALGVAGLKASSIAVPMRTERALMVADARLDNRPELQRLLGLDAAPRLPDCELLFRCWERWPDRVADHVSGDYAFAAFDLRNRTLTLARDPTGQRPLYFAHRGDVLAFASMPSGLAAILDDVRPNLDLLVHDLALIPCESDATTFAGIQRVLPSETLTFHDDRVDRSSWAPRRQSVVNQCTTQFVEQFRSTLDQAVTARISGENIATHLSSGWDSNAVTATAAKFCPNPSRLTALTSAPALGALGELPRGRYADETELAGLAAREYGVRHLIVRETERDLAVMQRLTPLCQMPIHSPTQAAWWSRLRHVAKEAGATTVLTGELGNWTMNFGGLTVLGDLARRGEWQAWWREATTAARRPDVRWRGILINSFGYRLPPSMRDLLAQIFQHHEADSAAKYLRPEWQPAFHRWVAEKVRLSGDTAEDRWRQIRANDIGPWRLAGMVESGVMECDATADRRLIEFSLGLPWEQLFHNGRHRPLARAALADRVPAAILDAKGRGMQSADWHLHSSQTESYAVLEEMRANSDASDLFDLNEVERTIAAWPSADWNGAPRMTYQMDLPAVLATGIFLSQFKQWQPSGKSPRI